MKSVFIRRLPIRIVLLYLICTVLLYAFGPVDYTTKHTILLYIYLILSWILLYIGYRMGIGRPSSNNERDVVSHYKREDMLDKWYNISFVIYIVLIPLTLYSRTGQFNFDFTSFANLGEAYANRTNNIANQNILIEWIRIICAPMILAFIPLGFLTWKRKKTVKRILFIAAIIGNVSIDLTTGTNRAFADLVIYCTIFGFVAIVKRNSIVSTDKNNDIQKRVKKFFAVIIILILAFIFFFSQTILSRTQTTRFIGDTSFWYFTSYFTQGYRALDYALFQPFDSTFGFGNSMYILNSTVNWFDSDFFLQRTYLMKNMVSYGLDYKLTWSSFYVWVANDVSIWGVLFICIMVGYILGRAWRKVLANMEFASIIVVGLMFQLCLYIPANNQIFQTAEAFFASWFWIVFWIVKSKVKIVFK